MKNEFTKEELSYMNYNIDTCGRTWFSDMIMFPVISLAMAFDNPDANKICASSIDDIENAIDKITTGKDPETELEIAVYKLMTDDIIRKAFQFRKY